MHSTFSIKCFAAFIYEPFVNSSACFRKNIFELNWCKVFSDFMGSNQQATNFRPFIICIKIISSHLMTQKKTIKEQVKGGHRPLSPALFIFSLGSFQSEQVKEAYGHLSPALNSIIMYLQNILRNILEVCELFLYTKSSYSFFRFNRGSYSLPVWSDLGSLQSYSLGD